MSTGYCNCVTLRAKVRLAIEAFEAWITALMLHSKHNETSILRDQFINAIIELKKEIGV